MIDFMIMEAVAIKVAHEEAKQQSDLEAERERREHRQTTSDRLRAFQT